ncbi:hypothetical protein [Mycolicibacterium aichiense]|uniref:Uncharacterized protein n=1 Tax=Mycolicibacterium aichiense TaxID=1799 RepID=A0AAD1HR67_9MYCO|nr:hypothetical protein [Mycolicibacterium aichiense]QFG08043.1 hypothetical protein SEA_HERBERTWM_76 [Mycobacterium phage Herbertwm]BBX09470.1 hypothetical protein MAIC_42730 [Mycolicibacterium aichiense]SUA14035.1 Uncharacterised protein [Mycolicibacterium aichiense]
MKFKVRCQCGTVLKAEKRKLFGIAVRVHEVQNGHAVQIKEL